jgi:hypothetical protein
MRKAPSSLLRSHPSTEYSVVWRSVTDDSSPTRHLIITSVSNRLLLTMALLPAIGTLSMVV